ncbi:MAG: alpha/beta hydrolase [Anaerolineales bacterium]|nr:alpha/beta hydrolase [Anaerolineales bacterium]
MLRSLNVRLIAVDRPGMGLSDFQPNRRLLDFPNDLLALADHLAIERFAILAYSLGGIHGLACARAISERLTKVGIVSGAALFTEPELMTNINEGTRKFLTMPRDNPFAARLFLGMMAGMIRFAPKLMTASAASNLPAPDRPIAADSKFQAGFVYMLREALRNGTRGAFDESLLAVTDYGFRLQDIQAPIQLWHGEADQNVPVEMARFAESALPKCEAGFYPNEGHLSLFKKYAAEFIRALV